jgi:hypothetical protein
MPDAQSWVDGSMINMLKRLWRDRRGNAIVIAAAALPMVIGSAGLASDTIQWTLWKRQLQRAADSAALAGVYARAQSQTLNPAISQDLANNNHLWVPLLSGYPQTSTPANTGTYINLVKVDLAVQQRLGFSSLFMSSAPIISTSATAAMVPDGLYCVVALNPTSTPGIIIQGSTNVNMGCGAISNSESGTSSVNANGTAYNFTADPVASVGGMPSSIIGATDLRPRSVALPDPFANEYNTTPPMSCTNFQSHFNNATNTISPGCFTGFNLPGGSETTATYTLQPGVYYLDNTSLSLSGHQVLVGTGVTIILTGTDPGTVSMSGNSEMRLSAPTTGDFAKMLFIQAANATVGNNSIISGTSLSSFDGTFYFPNGDLSFTGTSAGTTQCAMVVAYTVEFSGNSTIQNDTSVCDNDQQVSGFKIRLIA